MMTNEARLALRLRLDGSKASIKKLPKILELLSDDERLRHQYAYYKAHTGRWAGRGAQLQNLKAARTKDEKAMVSAVVRMLEEGKAVPNLDALSLALRPLLTAPAGKKVLISDFSSVENRVLMWASGCESGMKVYLEGKDPYIDFAARMEGCDYSEVTAEMRQQAKPAVLGAGFGLGGGQLVRRCKCTCKHQWNVPETTLHACCPKCGAEVQAGMVQKTGLWRYAEMMGVDLSQEDAKGHVDSFREVFYDVANFWYWLEGAYAGACQKKRPQTLESSLGCKLILRWEHPALRILLPSGRELVYPDAYAREERNQYGNKKLTLYYAAQRGHGWAIHNTYGGRLCENIVQAIAADLTVDAMVRVEEDKGLELVGHTHDELICLADENDSTALDRLTGYMSQTEPWAKGLPMAADGHEGKRYSK